MSTYHRDPAVRDEMRRILRERQDRPSYLMDYGYASRSVRTSRIARWAGRCRRFSFWCYTLTIVGLIGVGTAAIVSGHQTMQLDFPTPTSVHASSTPAGGR